MAPSSSSRLGSADDGSDAVLLPSVELPQAPQRAHLGTSDRRNGSAIASTSSEQDLDPHGKRRHHGRRHKGLIGRRRSQSQGDLLPEASTSEVRLDDQSRVRAATFQHDSRPTGGISLRPGGSVRILPKRKGSVPAAFLGATVEGADGEGAVEELVVQAGAVEQQTSARRGSSGAFPTVSALCVEKLRTRLSFRCSSDESPPRSLAIRSPLHHRPL